MLVDAGAKCMTHDATLQTMAIPAYPAAVAEYTSAAENAELLQLLTTSDVARLLGVTRQTVGRWAEEGRIRPSAVLSNGVLAYGASQLSALQSRRK